MGLAILPEGNMAEIKKAISDDLTLREVIGSPDIDTFMSAIQENFAGHPTKYLVWDFSEASLSHLSTSDIQRLVSNAKPYFQFRAGGKTAFVAPDATNYRLARMFEAFFELEDSPVEVQVFHDLLTAAKWIDRSRLPISHQTRTES